MSATGVALLDVNVIFALAWPTHQHHVRADQWFEECDEWSTTPITQSGFVRLSSNSAVTQVRMTPPAACRLLADITAEPDHVFWPDDLSGVIDEVIDPAALTGHRQVTDAHLISLAHRHGGHLTTFDEKLRALLRPGFDHLVNVIE